MASRQNFYNGLHVSPDHLNDMQSYTKDCDAELVSGLLGHGIVNGFEVEWTPSQGRVISVNGGLAYTVAGVRLKSDVVPPISVSNAHIANSSNRTIALGLKFKYDEFGEETDSQNEKVNTVWTPTVELVLGVDVTGDVLPIADIILEKDDVSDEIKEIIQNGHRFVNLMEQIENTQAFSTTKIEDNTTANIISRVLNINAFEFNIDTNNNNKAIGSILMDSALINLKTSDLQIDGVPFIEKIMETGSNDNGHYVKFSNRLLICFKVGSASGVGSHGGTMHISHSMPFEFINTEYITMPICDFTMGRLDNLAQYHTREKTTSSFNFEVDGCTYMHFGGYLAIGYWK